MTKPYRVLRERMSPEAQERSAAKAEQMLLELARECHETLESWPEIEDVVRERIAFILRQRRGGDAS